MKSKYDVLSAQCSRATTNMYSTSFSLGINLLGKELRAPIHAIYGFVRLADEIVDSFHDHDKVLLLSKFKTDCYEALDMGISLNPILNSFQKTVNDFNIDRDLIDLFLQSMEMDLEKQVHTAATYDQYILGSAQAVGLMCLHVFSFGDKATYNSLSPAAMKLGSAFQKVNFLRDINADYHELGRAYFPGVKPTFFSETEKRQLETEIAYDFAEGLKGIKALPATSKKGVYLAYVYYQKLFQKIKRTNAEKVMSERIRLSNGYKCWLALDSMLRYKIGVL